MRPQTKDRFRVENEYAHAISATRCVETGDAMVVLHNGRPPRSVPSSMAVELEQWSASQLCWLGTVAALPATIRLKQAVVHSQVTDEHDPIRAPFVWWGATADWGAACPESVVHVTNSGVELVGWAAVKAAVAAQHAPHKAPLAWRTWEMNGGPKPNWRRLFTTIAAMAMTPWPF